MRKSTWILCAVFMLTTRAFAYGPEGHGVVGAIADELLSKKPAGAKIKAMLDGITLRRAAVMPDEVKGWDAKGVDDPRSFHYRDHPGIDKQLCDFWRANPPTHDANAAVPSHHWFHYTDVPVIRPEKYADGKAGRNQWDIVHMIPYCVDVLQGRVPETNERKITKPVAIMLLAHFVGDIHQPLHVGAEYFNEHGDAIDPDKEKALEDEGGNTIILNLNEPRPPGRPTLKKLHGFWDSDAVYELLPKLPGDLPVDEKRARTTVAVIDLAQTMTATPPAGWQMPPEMKVRDYAEAWANEILPIAREAHDRLQLTNVHAFQDQDHIVAAGDANEKPREDHSAYRTWAAGVVRQELHKAGWRLADLLEKCVESPAH